MSLVNNSANNFKDFLDSIKPYLNYQFYDLSGQGVEANNFSTDEKVIGTWIDGKPLYQKTIYCGATATNDTITIEHGIVGLENVVSIIGTTNEIGTHYNPIPTVNGGNDYIRVSVTASSIVIKYISGWSSAYAYVTIRYTKTTDSAVASGEKIVGQWIDGKPVYEKTWNNLNLQLLNTSWTTTTIPTNGISKLIDAIAYSSNGTVIKSINGAMDDTYISINNTSHTALYAASLTLRYTKTTD